MMVSLKKIVGTPKGEQKFKNIPVRRYMNKALFYRVYSKLIKTSNHFSLN